MKTDITCKNITLDNPLRVFIEDKIGGLERYFGSSKAQVAVEIGKPSLHHRKGRVFYAEANLKLGSTILRANAECEDLRMAITRVRDDLQAQIKKFKERRKDLSRKPREA